MRLLRNIDSTRCDRDLCVSVACAASLHALPAFFPMYGRPSCPHGDSSCLAIQYMSMALVFDRSVSVRPYAFIHGLVPDGKPCYLSVFTNLLMYHYRTKLSSRWRDQVDCLLVNKNLWSPEPAREHLEPGKSRYVLLLNKL
jgi:hypothetical protein